MPSVVDDRANGAGELTQRTNRINGESSTSGKKETIARQRTGSMSAWDSAADPAIPSGSLKSAILFLIPCSFWVGSVIVTLISMIVLPLFGYYIPLIFFVLYYAKRLIFGHVKRWPEFQLWMSKQRNSAPYFKRQALILDDGVEPEHFRPGNKALMCAHPHGIFVLGWTTNLLWNKFSIDNGITVFGASSVLWIPGFGEYAKWLGTASADKANMERYMKKGDTMALCPGGFEEATLMERGKHRLFLKQRKGFIKLALRYGYKVYPVYSFGEEETYHSFTGLVKLRLLLNSWKVPGICFTGRYGSVLPLNHAELITVIGAPLECPLIDNPTNADVDHWHSLYMQNVQSLFDKYKGQYAYHKEKAVLELC